MATYLDMLPEELFQMVYKHTQDDAIQDCVRVAKRRSLPYEGKKTNSRCCWSWANGQPFKSLRMSTDGKKLYSYALCVGDTDGSEKVLYDYTAGGLGFYSQTTSQHVNIARRYADR
jgi:hypothetical protein